jgi:pilus assembly protein FimV
VKILEIEFPGTQKERSKSFKLFLVQLVIVFTYCIPLQVLGLGLGSLEMQTTLNQPLDAKIELLRVRAGELEGMTVALASPDTFRRAGLDRPSYLENLKFSVVEFEGGAFVKITSSRAITEPFLNFLVEVNWANGRLLREFTVLVDPPVLTEDKPAPVEAPSTEIIAEQQPTTITRRSTEAETPKSRPKPAPRRPRPPAPRFDAPSTSTMVSAPESDMSDSVGQGFNKLVKRGDTLWDIALKLRTETGSKATVGQIMLALLEANPKAFFGNNINNLKMGSVLRMEDMGSATNVSRGEATRIVDMQWQEFKESRNMVGSTPTRIASRVERAPSTDAAVKLLNPNSDEVGSDDVGGASSIDSQSTSVGKLTKDLTLAQEALDSSRQESKDVNERIIAMEEQLNTMQRLVNLKDEQMVALQNQIQKSGQEFDSATTDLNKDKTSPDVEELFAGAKPKKQESGIISSILNSEYFIIGLILAAVIVVIGWLVVRRRKMHEFQESILTGQSSMVDTGVDQFPLSEDASFMSDFAVSSMDGIQTDISEVDPISEADVYLAYGRYKQAEDLINEAIEKESDRVDLKLKLLEIHYAAKDKEAFELQAEMFNDQFAQTHPEMCRKVINMGYELNPANPLFAQGAGSHNMSLGDTMTSHGHGSSSRSPGLDETMIPGQDFDFTSTAPSSFDDDFSNSPDHDMGGIDDLDFDLTDLGGGQNSGMELEETMMDKGSHDNSIDFDLGALEEFKLKSDNGTKTQSKSQSTVAGNDNSIDFDIGGFESMLQNDNSDSKPSSNSPLDFDLGVGEETIINSDNEFDFSMDNQGTETGQVIDFEPHSNFESNMGSDDLGTELDESLFADVDEVGTKLDLAKAYIDMGDSDGAKSILDEVVEEGNDNQKQEAEELMQQIG